MFYFFLAMVIIAVLIGLGFGRALAWVASGVIGILVILLGLAALILHSYTHSAPPISDPFMSSNEPAPNPGPWFYSDRYDYQGRPVGPFPTLEAAKRDCASRPPTPILDCTAPPAPDGSWRRPSPSRTRRCRTRSSRHELAA